MRDRVRLPLRFDSFRLQKDLSLIAEDLWTAHFNTQCYDGDWAGVALRGTSGATHPILALHSAPDATEWDDTDAMKRCEYFNEVLAAFQCQLQTVRLLKLGPGTVIKEHCDHALGIEDGVARIHIPILTNPDVEFVLNNQRVVMKEGECWYMNFNLPHHVANKGRSDRVHLVLDCTVNDWLRNVLVQSVETDQEKYQDDTASVASIDKQHLSLRDTQPKDEPFLYRLFSVIKVKELGAEQWPEAQREQLLRMQFNAHEQHHQLQMTGSDQLVILDEQAIGRMIVQRDTSAIQLTDITLLPEFRNRGIGMQLIHELQNESRESKRPLRLNLFKTNRVISLYQRLGFEVVTTTDTQYLMEWKESGVKESKNEQKEAG